MRWRNLLVLSLCCPALAMVTPCAAAPPTPAVEDAAPFEAMLAACREGWDDAADYGVIQAIERVGVQDGVPLFHARMERRGKRVIFAGQTAEPGECRAFPVGRASAGAYGDFLGDGRRLRVFLVPENETRCPSKRCAAAVILRDADKTFLRVGWTGNVPCHPAEARRVALFDGQASVAISCRGPSGTDVEHTTMIFHATDDAMAPVLTLSAGVETTEGHLDEDGKHVTCVAPPAGTWRTTTRGDAPVVEAFEPDDLGDGAGKLTTYRYDPTRQRFVAGSSRPHTRDDAPDERCVPDE